MPQAADLGGIEQAVVHLSAALAARGHAVRCADRPEPGADFAVAVNDARLLSGGSATPILWLHNEVAFGRELRRGRLPALLRHRPMTVFCGTRQKDGAGRLLPLRRRLILPHGLPPAILLAPRAMQPPGAEVIFTSQAYRGLAGLIALWRSHIAPQNPDARFSAYIAAADVEKYRASASDMSSICIFPRRANAEMPALLRTARVLLAPGHRSETFCLAAAEAVAMGVPVVTFGLGALAERVQHDRTGFICRNPADMAARILALLADDTLWQRMHAEGPSLGTQAGWDHVAGLWENAFALKT